jgi:hypothetical protein
MKKKTAVFTIVKNESYFLPIWIKHHKKYFDESDIYVLDHQSNDGSTENITVNVVQVFNEFAFDHSWLVATVQNFQKDLLQKYECVLFAEADELIYTVDKSLNETIDEFLNDKTCNFACCMGYEVIQNLENETSLTANDKIFKNRNYWFKYSDYDKTLLSKIPLTWSVGFHTMFDGGKNYNYDLRLVHLHRVDFELMLKRHEERANKWNKKNDGLGSQHRIGDREGVLKYFKTIPTEIELIPESHKKTLEDI